METDDLLCSRNARLKKVRRRVKEAFFAPGARALRRASLDGRSRKLPSPSLGWLMSWENVSVGRAQWTINQPPSLKR
jgi:hypothetical protein